MFSVAPLLFLLITSTNSPPASPAELDVLADEASDQGNYQKALNYYQQALELREKAFGPKSAEVAETYRAIAWVYFDLDDKSQARRTLDHAVSLMAALRPVSRDMARFLSSSGVLHNVCGDEKRATDDFRRSLALYERVLRPSDPRFIEAILSLARLAHDPAFSIPLFQRAIAIERQTHSELSLEHYEALRALADYHFKRLDFEPAIPAADDALTVLIAIPTDDKPAETPLHFMLARAYLETGDVHNSDSHYRASLDDARLNDRDGLIEVSEALARIHERRSDPAAAAAKLEIAVAAAEAAYPYADDRTIRLLNRLGGVYMAAGRPEDANRANWRAASLVWGKLYDLFRSKLGPAAAFTLAAVLLVPLAIALVLLGLYIWLARRLDRRTNLLFEPPPPPPPPPCAEPSDLPPLPPPPTRALTGIDLRASGATLFAVQVWNLLLSICTLGVYSFWGKARLRRYLCGQAELLGDRFVFHGLGGELLRGWLKALPFLAVIVLTPQILPLFWQNPLSLLVAQLIASAAFFILYPLAVAGAHRYRLNRMSWRGIRFSFQSPTAPFFRLSLWCYFLNVITLGLYIPFSELRTRAFLYNRSFYGNRPFSFSASARPLLPLHILSLPLTYLTLGLIWPWWSALRTRYYWAHTTFGQARFRSTVTGAGLFFLWTTNVLLIVFTLGLAMPWVTTRTLRFWTRNIHLVGGLDLASIRQDAQSTSAMGESFADFVGFGVGI